MPTITIRERPSADSKSSNATISFDNGPLYDITISDPFEEKQEKQLEWYFEEHLRYPFKDQVKAEQCAKSITEYGEKLFQQVFRADPDIYSEYKDCISQGLSNVQVEIAGSPSFHRLHWESLRDPKFERPLVLQATFIRKNQTPQNTKIVLRQSTTINILVVTARPAGKHDVGYRTISRPMVEALRTTNVPVQIDILRPGTYQALHDHLRESTNKHSVGYYHVVHFDLHGALLSYDAYNKAREQMQTNPHVYKDTSRYGRPPIEPYEGRKAFLAFENAENEKSDLVEASELASLLIEHHVPIGILNACQSGKQVGTSETSLGSRLIAYGVQMVLAMAYSITVTTAQLLMETLYTQLFAKHDLATSIRFARQELYNRKERQALFNQKINLEDWLLPVVYQNQQQNLTVREFTPDEATAYYTKQAQREREQPLTPTFGFVGRDVDILQIEKRLLTQRNILLVRGMGGAGKTTLLHHLHTWWQTTGFVENVFYFGYDERAWNRQQILDSIAHVLLTNVQYATFQPLPLAVQQSMLAQRLRSERHLLILDNLESVTGAQLAIQNTLPIEEQQALRSFLTALTDGKTLVLLGSRSSEQWLADETFADNIYDLPGLDIEAASVLTERILERHKVTKYRDDPDLLHLLKLLDGFPLALEVILANLARQTPKQILEALQAGDINLDKGDAQKKTESIALCIEYSHSNLSPETQQLLLCLAPFNGVINQVSIEGYIEHLKQQPGLKNLPFERWSEVFQEAQNWGLLSPDPEMRYMHLQPVLPYFLRNRLNIPEQSTVKVAIETAFREYYSGFGDTIDKLLKSNEPSSVLMGQALARLEYENLVAALNLSLDAQVSILNLYRVLSNYLDTTKNQRLGLELGESVFKHLEMYPEEKLMGELGVDYVEVITDIGLRHFMLSQYPQAETMYKKALVVHNTNKTRDKKTIKSTSSFIYHQLGIVAQVQRQWNQAKQYYQQALQIEIEFQERYSQAKTYSQLGMVAQEQRQWNQAEHYHQQALQIEIEFQDRYSQAKTYYQLGKVAQEQRRWNQAKQYYQQALQILVEFQDRYLQAGIYDQLGEVAQEQREWDKAEYYHQQALQIEIEFQDRHRQAGTYHQLGMVAFAQRQWEQAERYYQQALQIKIEFQDRYSQASTYHQLGMVAQEQQQWNQAKQYFQQALQILVEFQDRHRQASPYHQLGRVAQEQRQWNQAEHYYQQALQILVESQDRYSQASPYHQLGRLAEEQQQWNQAIKYFLQTLKIFVEYNDIYNGRLALSGLARLGQASGDTQLVDAVASIVGWTHEQVEECFRNYLEYKKNHEQ